MMFRGHKPSGNSASYKRKFYDPKEVAKWKPETVDKWLSFWRRHIDIHERMAAVHEREGDKQLADCCRRLAEEFKDALAELEECAKAIKEANNGEAEKED